VNCEHVPVLPAWAVRRVLEDPRKIPYLLVWTSRRDGTLRECVQVAHYSQPPTEFKMDWTGWILIKHPDGRGTPVKTILRALPRNGGSALLMQCPQCDKPRRALYGWEVNRYQANAVYKGRWQCRLCAELRYASEGGALLLRSRIPALREFLPQHMDRPAPWYPHVFSNPADAHMLGVEIAS
jgi:hypothetical protein